MVTEYSATYLNFGTYFSCLKGAYFRILDDCLRAQRQRYPKRLYLDRLAALPVLKDFQRVYCSGRLVYLKAPNLSVLLAYLSTDYHVSFNIVFLNFLNRHLHKSL